jgi:hypothetical protein
MRNLQKHLLPRSVVDTLHNLKFFTGSKTVMLEKLNFAVKELHLNGFDVSESVVSQIEDTDFFNLLNRYPVVVLYVRDDDDDDDDIYIDIVFGKKYTMDERVAPSQDQQFRLFTTDFKSSMNFFFARLEEVVFDDVEELKTSIRQRALDAVAVMGIDEPVDVLKSTNNFHQSIDKRFMLI